MEAFFDDCVCSDALSLAAEGRHSAHPWQLLHLASNFATAERGSLVSWQGHALSLPLRILNHAATDAAEAGWVRTLHAIVRVRVVLYFPLVGSPWLIIVTARTDFVLSSVVPLLLLCLLLREVFPAALLARCPASALLFGFDFHWR